MSVVRFVSALHKLNMSIKGCQKTRAKVDSGLLLTPRSARRDGSRSRHGSACSRRGSSYSEYVSIFDKAFADAFQTKDQKGRDEDEGDSHVTYLVVYFILFFGVLLVDKRAVLQYVRGCFCPLFVVYEGIREHILFQVIGARKSDLMSLFTLTLNTNMVKSCCV